MRLGCGYPMGPLALLDLIGLDTAYEILDTMYKQGRDRLHAPSPILKQMVTAGLLGRKTGRGFYTYEAPDSPNVVADDQTRRRRTPPPRLKRDDLPSSASSAPARWRPASWRSSPRPATTSRTSAAAEEKVARRPGVGRALAGQGDPARQARGGGQGRGRSPGSPARPASTTSHDVDLVVEAVAEDLRIKTALFENLDEICKPGAILATTTSSLPVIALATATSAPAATSSACTSSTRRRS